MAMLRRYVLILLALVGSTGGLSAASFGENRAYNAAAKAFKDEMWERAETGFAQFATNYSKSARVPEAVLLRAEAQLKQGKFAPAVELLTARQPEAGKLADEYLYWIGEAQFQGANYQAAAEAFGRLTREFPTSGRRLEASASEAAARAKLGEWPRVVELLEQPEGAFQRAAQAGATNEVVVRGYLLLGEARLAQQDFSAAEGTLQLLAKRTLKPELDWQRQYLLCRIQLGAGQAEEALQNSANLLSLAKSVGRRDFLAEAVAFQAGICEKLGRRAEAMAVLKQNLSAGTSADWQSQALLKISELALAQTNQVAEASQTLENFLGQYPTSTVTDVALLMLGELRLKQHLVGADTNLVAGVTNAAPASTNDFQQAIAWFDQLINMFPNSPLVGKAQLDKGWCLWLDDNITNSIVAFKAAVAHLPPSEDRVIARCKLADALFRQKDYARALTNYLAVTDELADWPRLKGQMADRSLLLLGQCYADNNEPKAARGWLERLARSSPDSPLLPEAELVIACTRGQESDWPGAIASYDAWLERFATNALRPDAEYYRAWATFQAGNETNAFTLFTNFVAQFPTNDLLAPQAQLWVADYYFGQGDFLSAERNYKVLFQTWPASDLVYQARMMAGRAAVARLGYSDARDHFTNLTSSLTCPADLKAEALFAYGDVLAHLESTETNKPLANVEEAIRVFSQICQLYPTNQQAALAGGEIGDCYLQLAASDPSRYESASNAFQQVITSTNASVAARSQAEFGLGLVAEKLAQLKTDPEQTALLKLARSDYYDVFKGNHLREGEKPDLFWTKKAGLDAARLTEQLQEWPQLVLLYQDLTKTNALPQLRDTLEKKIDKIIREHPEAGRK